MIERQTIAKISRGYVSRTHTRALTIKMLNIIAPIVPTMVASRLMADSFVADGCVPHQAAFAQTMEN